jgi:hypothetical protein
VKHISTKASRVLTIRALVAELGPELAILAPDLAKAFPDSEAVNAALRELLAVRAVVRPKRGRAA